MNQRITIYVTADDRGVRKDIARQLARSLSEVAGGATITYGDGYWVDDGVLVDEPVILVSALCDGAQLSTIEEYVLPEARILLRNAIQKAMLHTIEGVNATLTDL